MEASMDPNQFALIILNHVTSGNYRALAAVGVMAVVFAIRTWLLAPVLLGRFKWLAWFKSDKGGVALNFIVSALGGVGNALMASTPITKELMLTSMVNACIAAGVFVSIKRLMGKPAEHPAVIVPAAVPVVMTGTIDTAAAPTVVPAAEAKPTDVPKPEESK